MFAYFIFNLRFSSFSLAEEEIKDTKVNPDCHVSAAGNWHQVDCVFRKYNLDLLNEMPTKRKHVM